MNIYQTTDFSERALIMAWNKIKKISYPGFRKWVNDYGIALAKNALSGNLDEEVPRVTEDYAMMDTDDLYEILLSVPGIGEKRAGMVIEKIIAWQKESGQSTEKVGVK